MDYTTSTDRNTQEVSTTLKQLESIKTASWEKRHNIWLTLPQKVKEEIEPKTYMALINLHTETNALAVIDRKAMASTPIRLERNFEE